MGCKWIFLGYGLLVRICCEYVKSNFLVGMNIGFILDLNNFKLFFFGGGFMMMFLFKMGGGGDVLV